MADATIRLPDEAALTGKLVRVNSKTISGSTVHEHVMFPAGLAVQLDDVGGGVTYVGEANPGSATASAVWRIRKITETGNDLTQTWANANDAFDQIWDNRLALAYS